MRHVVILKLDEKAWCKVKGQGIYIGLDALLTLCFSVVQVKALTCLLY